MVGCLKSILKIAILVLALIGFKAVGGFEWTHDMWVKYHDGENLNQEEIEKAKDVADVTKAGDNYKFVKNMSMMDYKIVISQHNDSGQKFAILKNKKDGRDFVTVDDIMKGETEKRLNEISKKLKKQYISINNINIQNNKKYSTAGKVKYVQFEAEVESLPFKKVKGAVGACKGKDGKNRMLLAANVADEYSQKITAEYFSKMFN